MDVVADITSQFGTSASIKKRKVGRVQSYSISEALDTDADQWAIDISDPTGDLVELLEPDNEVRVDLSGTLDKNVEALRVGFADQVVMTAEDGVLALQGRDVSALAVDSTAPPTNYTHARANQVIRKQALHLGFPHTSLAVVKPFARIFTDGSESYWEFWYRMYRKRGLWVWTLSNGTLVANDLNYGLKPQFHFGVPDGKTSSEQWIPVTSAQIQKTTSTRVGDVWVESNLGSGQAAFLAKITDKSIKHWHKRPLKIIKEKANVPATAKEARKEALEEIFEGHVGTLELTITILDQGFLVKQNQVARLNLPHIGYHGSFFIVGVTQHGDASVGYVQEIRLRQLKFAVSARVPPDPIETTTTTGTGASSTSGLDLHLPRPEWTDFFIQAAKEWRGVFKFANFLALLLSICEHETGFRNVRGGGTVEWYERPSDNPHNRSSEAAIARWQALFANSQHNPLNPRFPSSETAVGPMQLVTPSFKEYADSYAKQHMGLKVSDVEYEGGRWKPEANIMSGGRTLNIKLRGSSGTDESMWRGVAAYYGGTPGDTAVYVSAVKANYKKWIGKINRAQQAAEQNQASATVPNGTDRVLIQKILNNKNIKFTRQIQRDDIKAGRIQNTIMRIILAFELAGFPTTITALKCDHDIYTSEGKVSAHGYGHAVDFGGWTPINANMPMTWFNDHQDALGFDQLIGPIPSLVIPRNNYDSKTLGEHKDHIHVGTVINKSVTPARCPGR